MALSSSDIQKFLETGDIKIDPCRGIQKRFGPASLDFRLGRTFLVFERNKQPYLDPRRPSTGRGTTRTVKVGRGESFIIHPQELVLATTVERLTISPRLIGRLEGRSSIGRLGIIVHSTASVFHPGWDGHATMEIGNLGVMPVALYPGMRICQFTFEHLSSPEDRPYGSRAEDKYHGQAGVGPSLIWRELDDEVEQEEMRWGRQASMLEDIAPTEGDDK